MNTTYWEEDIETMSREKLNELQLQRLRKTVSIAANAPYYQKVFKEHGITAQSIQTLDDIRKIPFTTKTDMRAYYPFGLVAGNMQRDGVRIHSSSGTTGNPTVIVHSQHDLDSWANLVARCLYMVASAKRMYFKTVPVTECLPVASDSSTEPNVWEHSPYQPPQATANGR